MLGFDDPKRPSVTIDLRALPSVAQPPTVCAGIAAAQELDGSTQTPAHLGAAVPTEPGAHLQLTAFADDVADAGPNPCTSDPVFGRAELQFQWKVTQAPSGSLAQPETPTQPRTTFTPDLAGAYALTLTATDPAGLSVMLG